METLTPPQEIKWGKNIYDPATGDNIDRVLGVTRIVSGKKVYHLEELNGVEPVLRSGSSEHAEDDYSMVGLGYPGSMPLIFIRGIPDRPFVIEDVGRINAVGECGKRLAEVDMAYRSSLKINEEGIGFLSALRAILPQTDKSALDKIAVLQEELVKYVERSYPSEFLEIADEMNRLGIGEIDVVQVGIPRPGERNEWRNSFTADHLREVYGSQVQQHAT